MTVQMNIAEAKAKLSELVARAEAGEEVIIARDGKPAVVLEAVRAAIAPRAPGAFAHLGPLQDPDLFLRPDPEAEAYAQEAILPASPKTGR